METNLIKLFPVMKGPTGYGGKVPTSISVEST